MRFESATAHELARIGELGGLPGEVLGRLGERMERRELAPGEELELDDRFAVVLGGMVSGPDGLHRPGDTCGGRVSALTPATVASCERSVYEEITGSR